MKDVINYFHENHSLYKISIEANESLMHFQALMLYHVAHFMHDFKVFLFSEVSLVHFDLFTPMACRAYLTQQKLPTVAAHYDCWLWNFVNLICIQLYVCMSGPQFIKGGLWYMVCNYCIGFIGLLQVG